MHMPYIGLLSLFIYYKLTLHSIVCKLQLNNYIVYKETKKQLNNSKNILYKNIN